MILNFQKKWESIGRALQILLLIVIVLVFHYPWAFYFIHFASRQGVQPWDANFRLWCQWDCGHYSQLSQHYSIEDCCFFPAFPWVVRFFNSLVPSWTPQAAAVVTSSLLTFVATYLFLHLGKTLWPTSDQGKSSRNSEILGFPAQAFGLSFCFAVYPFSQFWMYGYSEPLFAIFLTALVLSLARRQWVIASIFAGLGAVTRPPGIWVLGLFLVFYFFKGGAFRRFRVCFKNGWSDRMLLRQLALVCFLGLFPFVLFLFWQWSQVSDPFYFMKLQKWKWGREPHFFHGLQQHIPWIHGSWTWLILSWFAAYRFIRRPEIHWQFLGWMTLVLAEPPLFLGGYYSYGRFMSVSLGLFAFAVEVMALSNWISLAVLTWAMTRLSSEVLNWLNGIWSN